ncbi:hypothetical protein UlMin_022398 [Ulmus minor]
MLAARNLQRHSSFKTLFFLLNSNPSNCSLSREFSPTFISSNVVQPWKTREDALVSSSRTVKPFNGWYREMSTSKGRSMRSRVENRMKKESGKTLREIRRAKKIQKKLMTENERLIYNLKRAKKKVALLLQKLKKYELPELPPPRHDPELLTPEQLQAYRKIGFKNKNYVPVGVRGVFGGVVQNMHLHWKFHETVQVCCDNFPKEKIKEMATMIARLSGGIVINTHNVKTIIMFRGRNYRQPKNLIPINTLTKRKALFKARFEQALESQKLNIKKFEQQLRRNGINPEDPVATASIQRVASSFFNAIDKKEGSPYVFHEDKLSIAEPRDAFDVSEPSDEKEQEELDKFIAEIEDAAEREWAAEEEAEKDETSRIRYWNREEFGGRYRRYETDRENGPGDEKRGGRGWKDTRGKQSTYDSDDEENDTYDSDDVGDADDSDGRRKFKMSRGDGVRQEKIGSPGRNEGYNRNVTPNVGKSVAEEDSEPENTLSDLESAMWHSDDEEEHESDTPKAMNYNNYKSDSDEEEGGIITYDSDDEFEVSRDAKRKQQRSGRATNNDDSLRRAGANLRRTRGDDLRTMEGENSHHWSSSDEEDYQVKREEKNESDTRKAKTTKEMDETWDSD